jgi:lysine 2,3-aminomutase
MATDMRTLRTPEQLARAGLVTNPAGLDAVAARYDIAVTPAIAALIATPDDPIGRQFIPHPDELLAAPDEMADPTGDAAHSPVPGVVHRYPDRALLTPLHACPVYCRYCFRRERVGADGGVLGDAALERALSYIAGRTELREVILTGGDPFMLSPRRLGAIVQALSAMPQLQAIRVHTRVPVAAPATVSEALVGALETEKAMWVVIHANHAREITADARAAVRRLLTAGIPVLAQSVLLRGVNDSVDALETLFRTLLAARVAPYALHQLDQAPGTARFRVPLAEGRALVQALRGRLSGTAIPHYLLDIPGGHGKVPVAPSHAEPDEAGGFRVTDRAGRVYRPGDGPDRAGPPVLADPAESGYPPPPPERTGFPPP